MDPISRIKRKYNYLLDNHYVANERQRLLSEIEATRGHKTIYLFCAPTHSNIGDQAQYYCWKRLFSQKFKDYNVVSVPTRCSTDETLEKIKSQLTAEDKLYVHSGYLIFDPHPELPFICQVVNIFHDYPITILPQTINLMSEKKQREIADCFNAHLWLTIVSRDQVSLQNAHKLFPNCNRLLWPDVVTSLIGDADFQYDETPRKGIYFCIRQDGEKYYEEEAIERLKGRFARMRVDEGDTSIKMPIRFWNGRREAIIRNIVRQMATYQLIITDRYHGTIFSQVANTPVIVLSSTDHKLSSGVKWFPKDVFGKNVFYANNLDECHSLAVEILKRNGKVVKNPPYFREMYCDMLEKKIDKE